jgi:hypothetical protein
VGRSPDAGARTTAAPSAIPFGRSLAGFASARRGRFGGYSGCSRKRHRRADRVGFDLVELLAAHGFLLHSFLSPIATRRIDS